MDEPLEAVLPLQVCWLQGHECKCPNMVGRYLTAQFGEDWYMPMPIKKNSFGDELMALYLKRIFQNNSTFLTCAMKDKLVHRIHDIASGGTRQFDFGPVVLVVVVVVAALVIIISVWWTRARRGLWNRGRQSNVDSVVEMSAVQRDTPNTSMSSH